MRALLGTGRLTWHPGERRTDRYGYVCLMTDDEEKAPWLHRAVDYDGKIGNLIAVIIETRRSTHIGDMFHGIGPVTPFVGEEIVLGTGTLRYYVSEYGWFNTGLEPDDGRETNWLDPKMLYRANEQTVELYFEEVTRDGS